MFRYLGLLWNAEFATASEAAVNLQRRILELSPRWKRVFRGGGVAVLTADCSRHWCARPLFGNRGVVLGEIFPQLDPSGQGGPVQGAQFAEKDTQALIDSRGRALISRYWGNYVALLLDGNRDGRYVIKDPCGSLPCHFLEIDGVILLFSCLEDCRELRLRIQVNWEFVRARIAAGPQEVREPSLRGVSTIHRGECVCIDREAKLQSRMQYWQPDFASADLVEPEVARRAMRGAVLASTQSMAAGHLSVLAQVSGGLDSSIVLGCLSAGLSGPAVTCYTFFVPNSVCDERRWARCATTRVGLEHLEVPLDPKKLLYADLPPLRASVEPPSYFTRWQKGPIEREMAARFGASTLFTGEGGDATFCSTSYVFAVDHCLRRSGLSFQTLRTAALVATRRGHSFWNILGKALARQVFGDSRADRKRSSESLRRLVMSEAPVGPRMNLETLLRMGLLGVVPSFYDVSASQHEPAPYVASPLCAQPVVELCARIPVDVHFDGGRIRGLARRAFADLVPQPILGRQWKDRPLLQLSEVTSSNLAFIREQLLDGALVKQGILNRAALEQALSGAPSHSRAIGSEILSHLDVELWIRDCA